MTVLLVKSRGEAWTRTKSSSCFVWREGALDTVEKEVVECEKVHGALYICDTYSIPVHSGTSFIWTSNN